MSNLVKPSSAISPITAALLFLGALCQGTAFAAITCTFSSVPGVAFGLYDDSSSAATDITSYVDVLCSRNGGPPNVTLEVSIGNSANTGQISTRALKNAASAVLLNYNLYRDTARSQVWGATPGVDTGSTTLTGISNSSSRSTRINIYGRITALQNATVGNYADALSITVSP